MPHLGRTPRPGPTPRPGRGPRPTGTTALGPRTALRVGFGVPGTAHPLLAAAEWAELTRSHDSLHWVVLNVAGGPGDRPDPHCLDAAGRLRNAGVRVLGHLDAAYGARSFGELVSDAHRYLDWYLVDGFYLARCPTERAALPEVRRTVTTLRALLGRAHVVFGHGTHPYPGYIESADQLVTFSGPWSDYRWSQVAEWTADYPPECFCHLVHGVPRGHLDEALRVARWQGASTIYFTDRTDGGGSGAGGDPWEALPGYWDEIVSRIGPGVSE
ncbi:spherulation-specific family 4 protein [Streptomyces sp. AN091965]|uniref:spherulation-specific family 4 protein n=1 Tax=Streptomyces sp. AN091965 TaxID=2927803 RepID=UPI001F6205C5|nr:spherulation-specific family 4 protein [Streptomyces sp. AN091965]MCI3932918.1 spherulation-specific family 4 protein [Streptomyces sp. AN091965]